MVKKELLFILKNILKIKVRKYFIYLQNIIKNGWSNMG